MGRNDIVRADGSIDYDYLGESIDGLSSQMAEITILPELLGVKGNCNFQNADTGEWYQDEDLTIPSTDDTVALQSIIDNFDNITLLLNKTYKISNILNVENKSINFIGSGKIFLSGDNSIERNIIRFTSCSNFKVKGIKFERNIKNFNPVTDLGWNAILARGGGNGILLTNCNNFSIENNEITYVCDGISISNCNNYTINNNIIHEIGQELIVIHNSINAKITSNNGYAHCGDGFLFKTAADMNNIQNMLISNNYIHDGTNIYNTGTGWVAGGGIGSNTEDSTNVQTRNLIITNNTIKNTLYGISFNSHGYLIIKNNKFYNIIDKPILLIYGAYASGDTPESKSSIISHNIILGRHGSTVAIQIESTINTDSIDTENPIIVSENIFEDCTAINFMSLKNVIFVNNIIKPAYLNNAFTNIINADNSKIDNNTFIDCRTANIINATNSQITGNKIIRKNLKIGYASYVQPINASNCMINNNIINAGSSKCILVDSFINNNIFDNFNMANQPVIDLKGSSVFNNNEIKKSDPTTYTNLSASDISVSANFDGIIHNNTLRDITITYTPIVITDGAIGTAMGNLIKSSISPINNSDSFTMK